jgi:hypothetical protein
MITGYIRDDLEGVSPAQTLIRGPGFRIPDSGITMPPEIKTAADDTGRLIDQQDKCTSGLGSVGSSSAVSALGRTAT